MYTQTEGLKALQQISAYAGSRADYAQGGGGNTSVKFGDLMAVKASGFRLSAVTNATGFVVLKWRDILNYHQSVDLTQNKNFEAESNAAVKAAAVPQAGTENLRPSVEAGFHSALDAVVIHTHSVYAALLVCSKQSENLAAQIFADADYAYAFLPYVDPGFLLSVKMTQKLAEVKKAGKKRPAVILMQNHGLVVHAETAESAMKINEDVNRRLRAYFGVSEGDFGGIKLEKRGDNLFASASPVVLDCLKRVKADLKSLDTLPLYPDQLVYLNNTVRLSSDKMKQEGNRMVYRASESEATTLEETLAAYLFVVDRLAKKGIAISTMNAKDVDFINNWEAEKFRRSQAK